MRITAAFVQMLLLVSLLAGGQPVNAQIIDTYAGGASPADGLGDGLAAVNASLNRTYGVAADAVGNLYIADTLNNRVRKVDASGVISTVAGDGTPGFSGDGGPAILGQLSSPTGVAVDTAGNLYIADNSNQRIRKVAAETISTVAGNGGAGFSGDGVAATETTLYFPFAVALDAAGNLYIADSGNSRIRKVDTDGIISTVAGDGMADFAGDGGPAGAASLNGPQGVAIDSAGNLYISDRSNSRIRKVDLSGTISTVAGTGTPDFSGDGGPATEASLRFPTGVAVDGSGNLLIADNSNGRIREVTPEGTISTIAGGGSPPDGLGDGLPATSAGLNTPQSIVFDAAGNLYIADTNNNRIRIVPTPLAITAPLEGAALMPGQTVRIQWTGGSPNWSMNLRLIDATANTIVTSVAIGQNTGSFDWGFPSTLPFSGPCGRTYRFYIENSTGTSWTYGAVLTVSCDDSTPPHVAPQIAGQLGTNGWYTSDVTVSWTVEDLESAISSSTGCDPITITADTGGRTLTCTATSTGGTATQSVTIKRDATPPIANATPSPLPNGAGWNNSNVSVQYSGTDAISGISHCSTTSVLAAEGANQQSASGTCTDNAGNVSAPVFASGMSIDKTSPMVSGFATPAPNAAGWNTSAVTVSFSAVDALSGVNAGACTAPVTTSANSPGQSISGSCLDRAGNLGSATIAGINIDTTPPVASAIPDQAPNANGWYNTSVTVSFAGTDSLTGSGIGSCSSSVVLSTDGAGQSAAGRCRDVAGLNSPSASTTVNIDTTPPDVPWIFSPVPNDGFVIGETPPASYSCSDSLSGIATCVGPAPNGAPIDTSSLGTKAFGVTATDLAGNTRTATNHYLVNPTGTAIITTIAGNGTFVFSSDGAPATSAGLRFPFGVAMDALGNLYIGDRDDQRVRKVSASGVISTVAGAGTAGFSGDGSAATAANLNRPHGVAVDGAGNIYIADSQNNRIRKVTIDGVISTVAGTGSSGFSGDGGTATIASLNYPVGITVDYAGNLFIADSDNQRIRKITASGVITTVAGTGTSGFSGDGGPATSASLSYPYSVAVDMVGNLFIADSFNQRIRKVTPSGVISTVAGNGTRGFAGDGGVATNASLADPYGVAVDAAGNVFIADYTNNRIRMITVGGTISTLAGDGTLTFYGDGGPATSASLDEEGVGIGAAGNLYVTDARNNRIRRVRDTTFTLAPMAVFAGQGVNVASAPQPVTLTNRGVLPVAVTGIVISGANANQFSQTNNCGILTQTAVNTTCTINVSFRPTSNGTKTAVLTANASGGAGSKSVLLYGTGGPTFSVAPAVIAFGNQPVTVASASQLVTLTNTGTLPVPITNIVLAGGNANQFSQTNTCGSSVPVGGACTISVVFLPTTVGAKTTTLNVNAGGGAGTQSVGLAGSGTPPAYTLTPGTLAFGNQAINVSSAGQTVTLTNTGSAAVPITSITRTATPANQFSHTTTCGASVTANASCTITVVFLPTTVGAKTATLNVNAGGGAGTQTVSLSGTGIVPTYALAPAPLGFGNQPVTVPSAALTVTVTNSGTLPVPVTGVALTGGNASQFSQTNSCSTPVAVGATCAIHVVFLPTSVGAKTTTLTVTAGGGAAPQTVSISGTGTPPTYALAPGVLAFGNQAINVSSSGLTATLTNTGPAAVPISSIRLTGTNANQFSATNTCGISVAGNAGCTITVAFLPTSVGAKLATLNVIAGGGAGTQTVSLSGAGIAPTYTLAPAPAFGNQAVNVSSAPRTVTLTNTGMLPVPITTIALTGSNATQFSQTNNCGTSVAIGVTCSINVIFLPTSVGAKTTTLTVTAGGGAATLTVSVSGTGIVPTYTFAPATLAFGSQLRNTSSAARTITLTNSGTLLIPITSIDLAGANPNQFSQTNTCGGSVAVNATCTISVVFRPTSAGAKAATVRVAPGAGAAVQTTALSGTGT